MIRSEAVNPPVRMKLALYTTVMEMFVYICGGDVVNIYKTRGV